MHNTTRRQWLTAIAAASACAALPAWATSNANARPTIAPPELPTNV